MADDAPGDGGWLPPEAMLPVTLAVQAGASRARHELVAPGSFRVHLDVRDEKLAGQLRPVHLDVSPTFHPHAGDWHLFGAFITRVELRTGRKRVSAPQPR